VRLNDQLVFGCGVYVTTAPGIGRAGFAPTDAAEKSTRATGRLALA
jgi:hypothetical protein